MTNASNHEQGGLVSVVVNERKLAATIADVLKKRHRKADGYSFR